MRISLVTETYPPEINGVAVTVARLVEGFLAEGHRVDLIRPRQPGVDGPRRV
ncbi:MAG: glycosyltransferase family 4 protein, partial [Verrucomicrobia bacterium]|nr:glycosyltransferase family 4 protein [Verrucomicrobiota bacterium]